MKKITYEFDGEQFSLILTKKEAENFFNTVERSSYKEKYVNFKIEDVLAKEDTNDNLKIEELESENKKLTEKIIELLKENQDLKDELKPLLEES